MDSVGASSDFAPSPMGSEVGVTDPLEMSVEREEEDSVDVGIVSDLPMRSRGSGGEQARIAGSQSKGPSFYMLDVYEGYVGKLDGRRYEGRSGRSLKLVGRQNEGGTPSFWMSARMWIITEVNAILRNVDVLQVEKAFSLIYMILLGFLCSSVGFIVNYAVSWLVRGREWISIGWSSQWIDFIMYTLSSYVFILVSAFCVRFISASAAGSGISQLKSILGGLVLHRFLNLRTLVGKMLGLIFSLGAGLSIGKEGPFVHIAAILAYQLCRLPFFAHIDKNSVRRLSMVGCACAAGIASNFGVVMGGVIFSIEVTATSYFISNLPKAFFVALIAAAVIKTLGTVETAPDVYALLNAAKLLRVSNVLWYSMLSFFLLGICCGLMAALFVSVLHHCVAFIKGNKFLKKRKFWWLFFMTFCTCAIQFPFEFIKWGDRKNISALIQPVLGDSSWRSPSIFATLAIFIVIKFSLTVFSPSLAIPAGAFLPVFVLGAAVGRLYGEILEELFPSMNQGAASYAMVGAAALSGAVTNSISTCIITYELVGSIEMLLPLMIAVLTALGVAKVFAPSIYDVISMISKLPFLPSQPSSKHGSVAEEVMRRHISAISKKSTYCDIEAALRDAPEQRFFPVVSSEFEPIGTIQRGTLEQIISEHELAFLKSQNLAAPIASGAQASPEVVRSRVIAARRLGRTGSVSNLLRIPEEIGNAAKNDRKEFFDVITKVDFGDARIMTPASFHVHAHSPITAVWTLFRMLGINHVFVTDPGKLRGIVTRTDLLKWGSDFSVPWNVADEEQKGSPEQPSHLSLGDALEDETSPESTHDRPVWYLEESDSGDPEEDMDP